MASPLAEQEGASRHVGPDQHTGQRLGCGPSEADLCNRKGKPAFASGTVPPVFTQFFSPLKAELSAPCHPVRASMPAWRSAEVLGGPHEPQQRSEELPVQLNCDLGHRAGCDVAPDRLIPLAARAALVFKTPCPVGPILKGPRCLSPQGAGRAALVTAAQRHPLRVS